MTATISPSQRRGISMIDDLRGGPNVELSEATEPMPPQTMQGLAGALENATTGFSSGDSLTLENLENAYRTLSTSQQAQYTGLDTGLVSEPQLQSGTTTIGNVGTIPRELEAIYPERAVEANSFFLKDKDWEKLYRSRKSVEEKVSHILIHSQNKIEEVQRTLERTESIERDIRKAIRESGKRTKELARDIRELKKRKRELESETEEQKKLRATRVVQDILALPKVKKIEVDEKKRIFITTDNMEVVKDYWDNPRVAGQYQILVDFCQSNFENGVRVLNITKRLLDQYDHPCINRTKPCWGNIKNEIENSFKERDLLEIIITMLLYISSPNDDTGWIEYSKKPSTERHKQGWEQFLEFATPCPKNFSFQKYEEQQRNTPPSISITEGTPTPNLQANPALTSMPSGARWTYTTMPTPLPSRRAQLIVPSDIRSNRDFSVILTRDLHTIIEFINPEMAGEFLRILLRNLEHNGFIFIKEMGYDVSTLRIMGWTSSGFRTERILLSRDSRVRQGSQFVRYDNPPWFREAESSNVVEYGDGSSGRVVPHGGLQPGWTTTVGSTISSAGPIDGSESEA